MADIRMDDSYEVTYSRRKCIRCGSSFDSTGPENRHCEECLKKLQEQQARPFVETSVQRRKKIYNQVVSPFDDDFLARLGRSKDHDDKERKKRQRRIEKQKGAPKIQPVDEAPNVKPIRVRTVVQKHEKVVTALRTGTASGAAFDSKARIAIAELVAKILGVEARVVGDVLSSIDPDIVYIGRSDASALAWRLVGNIDKLSKGITAPPWADGDGLNEWALVKVYDVVSGYEAYDGDDAFLMTINVYTGSLSGRRIAKLIKTAYAPSTGWRFGLSGKASKKAYAEDLVGFEGYCRLTLDPRTSNATFYKAYAFPGQAASNKDLFKYRHSLECPKKLKSKVYTSCLQCIAGHKKASTPEWVCRYATHPEEREDAEY